jgi:simple sugar transport system permease protein
VFQGLLLFALLACDTLIHYRVHSRSAFGASPSRGRPQRPGEAGSAASLGSAGLMPAGQRLDTEDK